ncbi:DarT ssDNA thymidine ADP-ribosyltransferase family protein [Klebsiella aerogenes]|uniref:DarT ssDNA thymidine ADP-ribosyltransferase family protein n=1 Tax=Enterobacteriaceae TaxID=543 RepID=UPI0013D4C02A|nr:DarT ssDNA thymidine ADP-ribosyltransferase family protein [Klebsiella aerogenes]EKU7810785.1 DUF4433 domain-containing protein [Klebsiella aerogenes]
MTEKIKVKIETQQLLYHLTSLANLPSILANGLMSRFDLDGDFEDVADAEILEGREKYNLHKMVPFHFFAKNPFDGSVIYHNPKKQFCLITVRRDFAKKYKWKIIPTHPLSTSDKFELCDYEDGFAKINWDLMNERDYSNSKCKSVCMAECLSPTTVKSDYFFSIFVKDDKSKTQVEHLLKRMRLDIFVTVNHKMLSITS